MATPSNWDNIMNAQTEPTEPITEYLQEPPAMPEDKVVSDGSTASYYKLPIDAKELQDLISFQDMNAQLGEIFRACYRYGAAAHSDQLRDIRKIKFYAEAEEQRLLKYEIIAEKHND